MFHFISHILGTNELEHVSFRIGGHIKNCYYCVKCGRHYKTYIMPWRVINVST